MFTFCFMVIKSIDVIGGKLQFFLQYFLYFLDRKSTRLNSSHANMSYAVFCLKKQNLLSSPSYLSTSTRFLFSTPPHYRSSSDLTVLRCPHLQLPDDAAKACTQRASPSCPTTS